MSACCVYNYLFNTFGGNWFYFYFESDLRSSGRKNNNIILTTKANRQVCALSVTVFCQTAHHVVFKQRFPPVAASSPKVLS